MWAPWTVLLADVNLVLETDTFQGRLGTIFLAFPIVRFSEINTDGISWELVTYYGWCDNRQRNLGQDSSFCTQMLLGGQIAALFLLIVSMWSLKWLVQLHLPIVRESISHCLPGPQEIFLDLSSHPFKREVFILFFVFLLCFCFSETGLYPKSCCIVKGSANDCTAPKTTFTLHSAELDTHLWH